MTKCARAERPRDRTQIVFRCSSRLGHVDAGEDVLGHRVQQVVLAVDVVVEALGIGIQLPGHRPH